ncbi:carboxymuconolactone decarboxylase family protein [Shewanella woodyi]|uniref:carboxymuconolactone decarboxylase family protein n=1 Tax=Shewanella woodyi TaxID=60961 RepID=UPI0037496137
MENSRFTLGLEQLSKIDGEAGHNVIESLQDICPDLAKFTIEYPFGDIYSRPALDLKSREIATIAALTALGHCKPQLKVHLNAALNVGCTEDEIKEVLLQMTVYAGFPAALNGMFAFKEVLQENREDSLSNAPNS